MKKVGGKEEGVLVHDVILRTVYQEEKVVRNLKSLFVNPNLAFAALALDER